MCTLQPLLPETRTAAARPGAGAGTQAYSDPSAGEATLSASGRRQRTGLSASASQYWLSYSSSSASRLHAAGPGRRRRDGARRLADRARPGSAAAGDGLDQAPRGPIGHRRPRRPAPRPDVPSPGDRGRGDRRAGRVDPRGGRGGDPQAPHPAPAGRADGLPFRRLGRGLDDRAPDQRVHPDRQGDLDALMAQMSPQWQSRQVADVLGWLRDYNAGHADKVRFVGVEYYLLRALAYDAVDAYVARTAPERLAEPRRHLQVIRPSTANMFAYIQWYLSVPDKAPYLRHARRVYALVKACPTGQGTAPTPSPCTTPVRSCRSTSTTACPNRRPATAWCTGTPTRPRTFAGGAATAATRSPTGGRARTPPTPPGCGSSCRRARTGAMRPPVPTCAAGTVRGTGRSGSPSTMAPSASDPGRPSPCHPRRRAGSSDRSAGSASTSSPWISTPPPQRRSGGGWRPPSGPAASPMAALTRTWPGAPWPSGST